MNVLFDSSVLVTAVVDQLQYHEQALECIDIFSSGRNTGYCSTHALAETYATLTALPLPTRIHPREAHMIVVEGLMPRLTTVAVDESDYIWALDLVSTLGMSSGAVYDALHLRCAAKSRCKRVYTYNTRHFSAFSPEGILISAP